MKKTLLPVLLLALTACTAGEATVGDGTRAVGQTGSSAPAAGLRIDLQTELTGSEREVLVRVDVKDDDGGGPGYRIQYGDGTYDEIVLATPGCPGGPLPATPVPYTPNPLDKLIEKRHKYAKAGDYAVQVRVVSQRPCAGTADEEANSQATVTVM